MLSHLSDISKIEVQAKDQYKLKVNTKKAVKKRRYITMFGNPFALASLSHSALFVQDMARKAEEKIRKLENFYYSNT